MLREFEKFTQGESNSPTAVALRATGFQRVGDLQRRLGEVDQAGKSYAAAKHLFDSLLVDDPVNSEYVFAKSTIDGSSGLLNAARGNYRDSIKGYSAAIDALQNLPDNEAIEEKSNLKLAKLLGNRANNYARIGELKSARSDFVAAAEILSKPKYRFQPDWMRASAHNRSSFASLLANKMKQPAEAVAAYQTAIKTYDLLASQLSDNLEIQFERASAKANLGVLLAKRKDKSLAQASLRAAFEDTKRLSETYPGFKKFRRLFAETSTRLASLLAKNDPEQADILLSNAKDLLTQLTESEPKDTTVKRDLAKTLGVLASMRAAIDAPDATDLFEQQLSQWQQLTRLEPGEPEWEFGRMGAENNYANFLKKTKRYDAAVEHYAAILKFLEAQTNPNPELLWKSLFGIASCHGELKNHHAALPYWKRLASNRTHKHWSAFEAQRIIGLLRTGNLNAGLSAAKQRLADNPKPKPIDHYDLACCYAIAMEVAQSDPELVPDTQPVMSFQVQAMSLLEKAAAGGFFKLKKWRNQAAIDPELNALRQLEEFQEFCQRHAIKEDTEF
jgi:tetratricopeptide (TPR) repeat protein